MRSEHRNLSLRRQPGRFGVMTVMAALLLQPFCLPMAQAAAYCTRLSPSDPAAPPGLAGHYQLVGKEPVTGQPYGGQLEVTPQGDGYRLRRQVNGQSVNGTAWMESCGTDRIKILRIRYATRPQPLEQACFARMDGDNYYQITCRNDYAAPGNAGATGPRGLEALFQEP